MCGPPEGAHFARRWRKPATWDFANGLKTANADPLAVEAGGLRAKRRLSSKTGVFDAPARKGFFVEAPGRRAALSGVLVFVGIFGFFRQIVGNQRSQPVLAVILNRLLAVSALELQHVQRVTHLCGLRPHVGPLLLFHD